MNASNELREMFEADQADRQPAEINWYVVTPRDEVRRGRVRQLVALGETNSSADWYHAAMVMQHGRTSDDYALAHRCARMAVDVGPVQPGARWLVAATWDRWLMSMGQPQRYGTQFERSADGWAVCEYDTRISDSERAEWNVPPIAAAHERARTGEGLQ